MKNAANANHVKIKDNVQRMNSSTPKLANARAYLNVVKMACHGTTIFADVLITFALSRNLFATGFKPKMFGSNPQDPINSKNQLAKR